MGRAADLHELLGRDQGVHRPRGRLQHLLERGQGDGPGVRAGPSGCCSSPTSTWAATPPWPWAWRRPTASSGTPTATTAASTRSGPGGQGATKRGHCSVHHRFLPEHVDRVRERHPRRARARPPRARRHEVVAKADEVGSTERIIKVWWRRRRPGRPGPSAPSRNLVHRLATEHQDKTIAFLDRTVCFCSTMNRIDLPHHLGAGGAGGRRTQPGPGRRGDQGRSPWSPWSGCSPCPARSPAGGWGGSPWTAATGRSPGAGTRWWRRRRRWPPPATPAARPAPPPGTARPRRSWRRSRPAPRGRRQHLGGDAPAASGSSRNPTLVAGTSTSIRTLTGRMSSPCMAIAASSAGSVVLAAGSSPSGSRLPGEPDGPQHVDAPEPVAAVLARLAQLLDGADQCRSLTRKACLAAWSWLRIEVAESSSATAPETCGVAIEVPLNAAHWPPGTAETTATRERSRPAWSRAAAGRRAGMKADSWMTWVRPPLAGRQVAMVGRADREGEQVVAWRAAGLLALVADRGHHRDAGPQAGDDGHRVGAGDIGAEGQAAQRHADHVGGGAGRPSSCRPAPGRRCRTRSLRTRPAAISASGATPIHWPLASPPATVPATWVPWRSLSCGWDPLTRWPFSSNSAQSETFLQVRVGVVDPGVKHRHLGPAPCTP